jgi:hypothetical protein
VERDVDREHGVARSRERVGDGEHLAAIVAEAVLEDDERQRRALAGGEHEREPDVLLAAHGERAVFAACPAAVHEGRGRAELR